MPCRTSGYKDYVLVGLVSLLCLYLKRRICVYERVSRDSHPVRLTLQHRPNFDYPLVAVATNALINADIKNKHESKQSGCRLSAPALTEVTTAHT